MLKGVAIGAALVTIPATASYLLSDEDELSVRVADDSPLLGMSNDKVSGELISVSVMRACGVLKFQVDSVRNDHTGSSFFKVADTSTKQLNCVFGLARARQLGIAFADGYDTTEFYDLPGDPTAYTRCEPSALIAGTCQPKKKN